MSATPSSLTDVEQHPDNQSLKGADSAMKATTSGWVMKDKDKNKKKKTKQTSQTPNFTMSKKDRNYSSDDQDDGGDNKGQRSGFISGVHFGRGTGTFL